MMQTDELRTNLMQAVQLRKDARYKEAITIYAGLWPDFQKDFSEWDSWSYAFCLTKINCFREALAICRKVYPACKDFEMLKNLYAVCIFHTQFLSTETPDRNTLKKALEAIYKLSDYASKYSVTPRAVFRWIKFLTGQKIIDWQEILNSLERMDPDLLDGRPFLMVGADGKTRELASPLEEWYAFKIKALAGLNKPHELLDTLHIAREKKIHWHYNNDIWFARKEAFAFMELGERQKAEIILRRIVSQKGDWFLLFDLANVVADPNESFRLLCKAALAKGKSEMKLKLFAEMAGSLEQQLHKELAGKHLLLVAALRKENQWDTDAALMERIKVLTGKEVVTETSSAIAQSLLSFWKEHSGDVSPVRMEGIIQNLLPSGFSGFIKSGKEIFYFNLRGIKGGAAEIGKHVAFELKDSFDKKKNRVTKIAVHVVIHD